MAKLSRKKAKEIMSHGSVRGHKLTKKQRGLFGAVAGKLPARQSHSGGHNPGLAVRDEMTDIP